jgi:hypothetical protein
LIGKIKTNKMALEIHLGSWGLLVLDQMKALAIFEACDNTPPG